MTPLAFRRAKSEVIDLVSPRTPSNYNLKAPPSPESPIIVSSPRPIIKPSNSYILPSCNQQSIKRCRGSRSNKDEISPVIELSDSDSDDNRRLRKRLKPSGESVTSSIGRDISTIGNLVAVGSVFESIEEAQRCIYAREANRGHRWRRGQSKKVDSASAMQLKKLTLRCNHYYQHKPTHLMAIDPSDHRKGKTIKTGCGAHVNLNLTHGSTLWQVTLVDWEHNHPREIPPGGSIMRPPTVAQRQVVSEFATTNSFERKHISSILTSRFPDHPLEPRQVSNMINDARQQAREEVLALGGDIAAIIAVLQRKIDDGERWQYKIRLDESQVVIGLWWLSPNQLDLAKRFFDILINDNTYNQNQYQYPLNIGIIIDNFGASRNAWYAFQAKEDTESHRWIIQCHLEAARRSPEVFLSDRHGSLISAVSQTIPLARHLYCLHHLNGNVTQNLRVVLGPQWEEFTRDFWIAYRAVSPTEFDRLWTSMVSKFPRAKNYLGEIYDCRERWAWAWVSHVFTAGIRTNGRVEVENRINKVFGGPKKTLLQLFNSLNERANGQTVQEMVRVREVKAVSYWGTDF
jgi:hypothetical protein